MKLLDLQYLPQTNYFALLLTEPEIEIDGYEHFVKQTYRNRCRILTANGIDELSIPVLGGKRKILTKDIRIDYSQKWFNRNWRAIQSAYGKAPFFEYYAEDLLAVYQKKHEFLFDLTHELLTQCLDFLQFDVALKFTTAYHSLEKTPQNDFRSKINPKSTPDIINSYTQFIYPQVFGNNFVNNLSVIDLIFCEGPQAGVIIKSGIAEGTQ
jgi:WbqC-like protein family